MTEINRFKSLATMETSIGACIAMMGSSADNKGIAGMVVVVDEKQHVVGVVTDGDVRRGLINHCSFDQPVNLIANPHPLTVNRSLPPLMMRRAVMDEARARNTNYLKYDRLILVEEDGTFYDVIRLSDILEAPIDEKIVAVYGMGFVGLTLAATLAEAGFSVIGIDTDAKRVEGLKKGMAPFYERGLDSMLSTLSAHNPIHYTTSPTERTAQIHLVSVGTPVDAKGTPDLRFIKEVAGTISKNLRQGDIVIFRSTVPVGTTRQVILPLLEQHGAVCGRDFHLAFAPERTVEGNALEELRTLPQIVGGYSRACTSIAAKLFRHITHMVIEVESLEEAELVKLMNNTFRDLVFSFANEVSTICDHYNINAFDVIRAANEGYPRNRIPLPSPGVGGICLSKDPYLYTHPLATLPQAPVLGVASRSINSKGAERVFAKLEQFARYVKKPLAELDILIVGLAFKGMPETSDYRASVALDLMEKLPNRSRVHVKDFVVPKEDILGLKCQAVGSEIAPACKGMDAILIMNNHYLNNKFNAVDALKAANKPVFFFDGWNLFNRREIEAVHDACYATLGYMTPKFRA